MPERKEIMEGGEIRGGDAHKKNCNEEIAEKGCRSIHEVLWRRQIQEYWR